MMGQQTGSREHLKMAQQFFQLVGSSASECDTIPGRQCMASCFFLLRQFDDVLIYCRSIKAYLYGEDDFLWNFGIALASKGEFKVHGSSPLQHQTVFGLYSSSRIAPLHLGALTPFVSGGTRDTSTDPTRIPPQRVSVGCTPRSSSSRKLTIDCLSATALCHGWRGATS